MSHHPFIALVISLGFLLLAFSFGVAAVKVSDLAQERQLPWWVPFILFTCFAYFFAFHGLEFLKQYDGWELRAVYTNASVEALAFRGNEVTVQERAL